MADIPWQSADHLSAGTGAAQLQMPWCGVPRQWAQCWAIIPCVSRDWPPIWRGPLVCIHATLRSIIRWACQFSNPVLSACYKYCASSPRMFAFAPSIHPAAVSDERTLRSLPNDLHYLFLIKMDEIARPNSSTHYFWCVLCVKSSMWHASGHLFLWSFFL